MPDAAARLVVDLARRAARDRPGTLCFEGAGLPGGRPIVTGSGDPVATVMVHDPRTWRTVLRRGSRGLAESYMDAWWDTDDLTALVRVAFHRTAPLRRVLDASARHVGPLLAGMQRLRPPSKSDDRNNIAAHYDLSNEFFAAMLDPTMAYSCAYFADGEATLEEAQVAKFERIATKLALGPEDHGLADRVTVLGADYRDLEGRYDALVSIEMVEAVDWRRHDQFFATCARLLTDRGRMALQAITIADGSFERARLHDDFIRAMVFPGGCLPSVTAIAASVARTSDLRIVDLEDIGPTSRRGASTWHASASTSASGGSGPCTCATARLPSWSATCPTCR